MPPVAAAQRSPVFLPHPVEHGRPFGLLRWLDTAWFPWVWMAIWAAMQVGHALVSWHFVATGAALLRSDGAGAGLHLYAAHPQLQMGPLTFLAAAPLNGLPTWLSGSVAAVAIAAAGPVMLLSLAHMPHLSITDRQRGLAAAVLMPLWAELAVHYTHLDDALALVLLIAGIHAVARCRPTTAALLLAASADAKPWALAFVPLLLVLPRDRRHRTTLVWLAAVSLAWLPFVLADPHTLHVGGFSIPNVASSSLRALGVTAASTPSWDRPVQLLAGVVLGAIAVRRGRWLVLPGVVLAVRMLLDPGAYPYYTAGLVLATILLDVGWRRTRWPWVSMGVVVGLYAVRFLGPLTPPEAVLGWLRAGTLLGVLAVALGPDWRRRPSPSLHKGLPTSGKCPDDAPELGRTSDERRRFGLRFSERASLGFASRTTRATRSFAERRCSGEVGPQGASQTRQHGCARWFLGLDGRRCWFLGLGISGVDGRRSFQDRDRGGTREDGGRRVGQR